MSSSSSKPNTETYQPNWHIRAITAPGPDSDLSLHVAFDNARFLFGCGEGTQRAFTQKRLTMRGLSGIFIGSGESRGRAGLAGVLMTAADAGIPKVDIIGPPDVSQYLATLRSSVVRDALNVQMHAYPRTASAGEPIEMFKSPNITVRAIALTPSSSASASSSAPSASLSYPPYDPQSPSFRPTRLSPTDTQTWCDRVVSDMFQTGSQVRSFRRATSPPRSPTRPINPLVNPDGTVNAARPDTRMPLPLPSGEDVETQMVYICQAPDVRGKFDVNKANALGVPKGPLRGTLTRGESIEVDDSSVEGGKRTVKPEDCLVGGGPGSVLMVVNCTEVTLSSLIANKAVEEYQELKSQPESKPARHVHVVVHRVPKSVWQTSEYQAWMAAFGETTQHLIADPSDSPEHTVFNSAAWNTLQLSLLDSQIFTPPYLSSPETTTATLPPNTSFLVQCSYCRMHPPSPVSVLPPHEKDVPFRITSSEGGAAREKIRHDMPEYAQACDVAQEAVKADPRSTTPLAPLPGDDIVVTTLGTGSAIPSKYRNVSATHLSVPGVGGILLDCGEGTLGQLRRRYGRDGVKKIWEQLRMIFISHMHADHHLGLNALLEDRFKYGVTTPLFIVAPPFIALNMQESASWQHHAPSQEALENIIYININRLGFRIENRGYEEQVASQSNETVEGGSLEYFEHATMEDGKRGAKRWPFVNVHGFSANVNRDHWTNVNRLLRDLELKSIWAPTVQHRGRAYGLALEHSSGWKVVYSGDTKPCDSLVEVGKDATLLIHEATLEDDKPEVAAVKGHSTFSQAIDIGKRMNARHILLNHFSQRYPKLPKLPAPPPPPAPTSDTTVDQSTATTIPPVVSISFDFMSIRISDMWKMSYYMDPLSMLFAEVEEEGEGEDGVLGAVEGDVNPTLDKKGGKAGVGKAAGAAKAKPMPGQAEEGKKSKRSMKKEAARAANKANGVEGQVEKRAGSPGLVEPEAKRRSTEGAALTTDVI
ncbi:hypothetical protein CI109_105870 [Kwoniella shandongensis]|uniref:ribonuclease Z n=1 Tax=Kwoniella shandongensis TaxID=1734106 RepID=A0A5M6BSV1_9TREE|nr:uncharacterized protein CI109_005695 [Kwoniella shandongensis]KAA5525948.1 hypothetical protein CI109_005695 [Kwoniella shandongensis]